MRKKKIDSMKAMNVVVTMNPTIHTALTKFVGGRGTPLSTYIQERALDDMLGITVKDLESVYHGRDIRSKRDSLSKEQVRIARWIYESRLHEVRTVGCQIWLQVEWLLTGVSHWVCVDNYFGHGFQRVIYDDVCKREPHPEEGSYGVTEVFFKDFNEFKRKVLTLWFQNNGIGFATGKVTV